MPRRDVRREMVSGAVRLLAEKGMEGTSFAEVLELVDAPRGSVYHHFPGGKQELIGDAVTAARGHALGAMEPVHGEPATVVVARFTGLWRQVLAYSDLRSGCLVLAVTVSSPDPKLLAQAALTFQQWRAQLTTLLNEGGVPQARAASLASTIISACEGAVVIARAERDMAGFEQVASELALMTEQAMTAKAG